VAVAFVTIGVSGWAVRELRTTARLHDLLPADSRVIHDYAWLEEHIGPLVPVEVVLIVPKNCPATMVDRLMLVEEIRRAIERIEGVGATISAANFGPALPPSATSNRGAAQYAVLKRKLDRHRKDFLASGYLVDTDENDLWRTSVRVPASVRMDYAAFLADVRAAAAPVLGAEHRVAGARAEFCGGVPLVQKTQEQLLSDLIQSFLLAFVMIAVAVSILLRSVLAGFIAMIPNVLPCVLVFGVPGWLGTRIEIGAVMTASVALGAAVDGTLHFITWFRRGIQEGMNRPQAVEFAFTHCGTAMVQSSMICGLGLLVFSGSDFVPIRRFAWMMFTPLAAALVADIVVTPVVLAGRLGRYFEPRSRRP
jgi:uncharacterized protein